MSIFYHVVLDSDGKWIKSPNNGGECCTTQEDTVEALNKLIQERDALQARVERLEEALEFGVGSNRAKELMRGDHVGEPNEMVAATKEVSCPDCYGGHFRPCNICGDSGVALLRIESKDSKP